MFYSDVMQKLFLHQCLKYTTSLWGTTSHDVKLRLDYGWKKFERKNHCPCFLECLHYVFHSVLWIPARLNLSIKLKKTSDINILEAAIGDCLDLKHPKIKTPPPPILFRGEMLKEPLKLCCAKYLKIPLLLYRIHLAKDVLCVQLLLWIQQFFLKMSHNSRFREKKYLWRLLLVN